MILVSRTWAFFDLQYQRQSSTGRASAGMDPPVQLYTYRARTVSAEVDPVVTEHRDTSTKRTQVPAVRHGVRDGEREHDCSTRPGARKQGPAAGGTIHDRVRSCGGHWSRWD